MFLNSDILDTYDFKGLFRNEVTDDYNTAKWYYSIEERTQDLDKKLQILCSWVGTLSNMKFTDYFYKVEWFLMALLIIEI